MKNSPREIGLASVLALGLTASDARADEGNGFVQCFDGLRKDGYPLSRLSNLCDPCDKKEEKSIGNAIDVIRGRDLSPLLLSMCGGDEACRQSHEEIQPQVVRELQRAQVFCPEAPIQSIDGEPLSTLAPVSPNADHPGQIVVSPVVIEDLDALALALFKQGTAWVFEEQESQDSLTPTAPSKPGRENRTPYFLRRQTVLASVEGPDVQKW
jgi:hypothetical protein